MRCVAFQASFNWLHSKKGGDSKSKKQNQSSIPPTPAALKKKGKSSTNSQPPSRPFSPAPSSQTSRTPTVKPQIKPNDANRVPRVPQTKATENKPTPVPVQKPVSPTKATPKENKLNVPERRMDMTKQRRAVSVAMTPSALPTVLQPLRDMSKMSKPPVPKQDKKHQIEAILRSRNLSDKELRESLRKLRLLILNDGLPPNAEVWLIKARGKLIQVGLAGSNKRIDAW